MLNKHTIIVKYKELIVLAKIATSYFKIVC